MHGVKLRSEKVKLKLGTYVLSPQKVLWFIYSFIAENVFLRETAKVHVDIWDFTKNA